MGRLIADGKELDLGRESIIALNFVIKDFREPDKVKGNFSKTIKLPATKTNQQVLGTNDPTDSTLSGHNTLLDCVYIGDSGVTQFTGFLEVRERAERVYNCTLTGENASWAIGLKGKNLKELDLGVEDFNTTEVRDGWDADATTRNTCYPIIDYGRFNTATIQTGTNQFRPSTFVANIVKRIFNDLNYTVNVKGRLGTFWNKLILPFTDVEVTPSEDVLFANSARVLKFAAPQNLSSPTDDVTINFNAELSDPNNNFSLPTDEYTVPFDASLYNFLIQNFRFTFDPNTAPSQSSSGYVQLVVMVNAVPRATRTIYPGVGATEAIFSPDTFSYMAENNPLEAGDVVTLQARLRPNPFTGNVLTNVRLEPFGQWRIELLSTLFQTGFTFSVGQSLPDMTQLELLQGLIREFNLVMQTDESSREVTFQWYGDWKKPVEQAVNWSDKVIRDSIQVEKLKELGGQIEFKQKDDSNDSLEKAYFDRTGRHRGDHTEVLDDEYDNKVQTIQSPFAATMMGYIFDAELYVPRMIRTDQPFPGSVSFDHVPRLLIFEGLRGGTFNFLDDDTALITTETEYPFAYSILEDIDPLRFSLYFGTERDDAGYPAQDAGLVDAFYSDTIRAWNINKLLRADFYLNDVDIAQLDLSKPVIIDESHYMINKIQDWQSFDKPVRVELIKIT